MGSQPGRGLTPDQYIAVGLGERCRFSAAQKVAFDIVHTALFYLAFDRENNIVEWIRAGHDPALVYDPQTDQFEELKGPGLALGVVQDYEYQLQRKAGLKDGQIVIIGTDGIWESCNPDGEMFGKERLKDIVREMSARSADVILGRVFQEQAHFSEGVKKADDLTLVVVKVQH